ncbi:hypothetical protein TIFTF001_031278 [Ficus carica]|uniref:Uncharacterized protein n=1 Tax=Ficus carica TaxID=3494 RepID=A0AA88J3Z8_FICCA|nr:hypothetical protein TIFTF001_031278 [Ficus carica]
MAANSLRLNITHTWEMRDCEAIHCKVSILLERHLYLRILMIKITVKIQGLGSKAIWIKILLGYVCRLQNNDVKTGGESLDRITEIEKEFVRLGEMSLWRGISRMLPGLGDSF